MRPATRTLWAVDPESWRLSLAHHHGDSAGSTAPGSSCTELGRSLSDARDKSPPQSGCAKMGSSWLMQVGSPGWLSAGWPSRETKCQWTPLLSRPTSGCGRAAGRPGGGSLLPGTPVERERLFLPGDHQGPGTEASRGRRASRGQPWANHCSREPEGRDWRCLGPRSAAAGRSPGRGRLRRREEGQWPGPGSMAALARTRAGLRTQGCVLGSLASGA